MQLFFEMQTMQDATLKVVSPPKTDASDDRLPYRACVVAILGVSAVSYWAIFRLIWALVH
jgi:hypothetical protein